MWFWSRAPLNSNRPVPTKYRHLRLEDRYIIHALRKLGISNGGIAGELGVCEPTVSREIRRNSGLKGYRPKQAHRKACVRKARCRRKRLISGELQGEVEARLAGFHSPEQISGSMAAKGVEAPSHQTIYTHIRRDRKAGGSLYRSLRRGGRKYYRQHTKGSGRGKIPERVGIEERPPAVENRTRYGHWEADLVEGAKGTGFVLALYERKSRTYLLAKLGDKRSATVSDAMIAKLAGWKVLSVTYDNGLEFSGHIAVGVALDARSYFCNPYSSWEKGGVENANGLLRQYLPKGMSFEGVDDLLLEGIEEEMNTRPREVLGFDCPMDYHANLLTAA